MNARGETLRATTARPWNVTAGGTRPRFVAPHRRVRTADIVCVALVLTALFFTPLVLRPADAQAYYLALVLTTLTALPVVARIASGTFDPFEPIVPISALIGLAFGVRTMYLAYEPVTLFPLRIGYLRADEFTSSALLLTIVAYCSLLAGYYVIAGPIRFSPSGASRWGRWAPTTLSGPKMAALLGIAALATAVSGPISLDGVEASTTPLAVLGSLVGVTGCILALHVAAGDTRRWLQLALWCVVIPLAAWQSSVFTAKTPILLAIFAILAAYHYARRQLTLSVLVVGVTLSVIVVFPLVNAYRSPPGRYQEPIASSGLVGQIVAFPTRFAGMTSGEYVRYAGEGVLSRSTGVDALSLLLKYDVSRELGNAGAYLAIPLYAYVPRAVWPTKPILSQGGLAGQLLAVPGLDGMNNTSSYGIFHIGDLFVTFGVSGVLIGMCVLGCLYRLFYKFFDPMHNPDLGMKFLYILLL